MVGLDSYSPDNEPFEIHKMLLKRDILIVENLVNLDRLVGKRFRCYVMPLKIQDADGAPCRVIGIIE
jgi:kynurenine formamidase